MKEQQEKGLYNIIGTIDKYETFQIRTWLYTDCSHSTLVLHQDLNR